MYTNDLKDKISGALMGVAVGDALGCTLEFLPAHSRHKKHTEIIGGGTFKWKKGQVTDDTDMTLCVARGILDNPNDPINSIGNEFLKWLKKLPKDIGNTCLFSIQARIEKGTWKNASLSAHRELGGKSGGNGSLMRCIPVALYYDNYKEMRTFTEEQSFLTHYDNAATNSCVFYNQLVSLILKGASSNDIRQRINSTPFRNTPLMSKKHLNPTGFSVDSLQCALWCFTNTSSFEEAVTEAVNLCGDADTIGAITGGLAGAYYGYNNIPERWKNSILIKDEIIYIANKFIR